MANRKNGTQVPIQHSLAQFTVTKSPHFSRVIGSACFVFQVQLKTRTIGLNIIVSNRWLVVSEFKVPVYFTIPALVKINGLKDHLSPPVIYRHFIFLYFTMLYVRTENIVQAVGIVILIHAVCCIATYFSLLLVCSNSNNVC